MNIIDQQFYFIVEALQPYSSSLERARIAHELGICESTIAKLRDGRATNPTRSVMSKLSDYLLFNSNVNQEAMQGELKKTYEYKVRSIRQGTLIAE